MAWSRPSLYKPLTHLEAQYNAILFCIWLSDFPTLCKKNSTFSRLFQQLLCASLGQTPILVPAAFVLVWLVA